MTAAFEPARAQEEFEAVFLPIASMAYGTAIHLTRDRTEAEDLVQDAVLLAFRGFGSFQPGTNFKAWFFRILTNAFYSRHRRAKRERNNLGIDDLPPLYLYGKAVEIGLEGQDPAAAIMDRFDSQQVSEALDALPEEYRVVSTLYFMQDFSYQQIADIVGCPVGTVRSRLHRARALLTIRLVSLEAVELQNDMPLAQRGIT